MTYRNATKGGPNHGHRGSAQKIRKDRSSGSRDARGQTEKLIAILRSPTEAE